MRERLSRMLAGCAERAYRDEFAGFVDSATQDLERRVSTLIERSGNASSIIRRANEIQELGQLRLPIDAGEAAA